MSKQKNDPVHHPGHYTAAKIEVIDFTNAWNLNFNRGSAVKYLCRAGIKNPDKEIEDLRKAIQYTEFEIRRLEELKTNKEKEDESKKT